MLIHIHQTKRRHHFGYSSLIALPLLFSQVALAEDESLSLEPIQVTGRELSAQSEQRNNYTPGPSTTATSLPMSIKDTPQAVSVITSQQIRDQALTTSGEILHQAPGVSMTRRDSNRFAYSARGYGISTYQFDGLMTPIQGFWNFGDTDWDSAIYDRIEVVRGATGLLTGAGDPSASVNFIRKKPLPEFAGQISATTGSHDKRRVTADISSPLDQQGRTAGRMIVAHDKHGTHVSGLKHEKDTLYGVINTYLDSGTDITMGLEYQNNQTRGMGAGFPLFHADGGLAELGRSASNNTDWSRFYNETTRAFFDINHYLANDWRLRAAFSHDDGNYGLTYLFRSGFPDRTTGEGMGAYFAQYRGDRTRQDMHFTADGNFQLFSREHELALGLVHTRDKLDMRIASPSGTPPTIGRYHNGQGDPVTEPDWGPLSSADNSHLTQTGAYAVTRLSLSDPLHLVLGTRLSNWKLDQTYFGEVRQYEYKHELTPYAGLVYDMTPGFSTYLSYTDIFQTQNRRAENGSLLDPIVGRNYEIGIKASVSDDFDANFALFRSEQDNLGEAIPGGVVNGMPDTQAYRPTKGAQVEGFEAEFIGTLAHGWNISGSYTLAKPRNARGERINTLHPEQQVKLFTTYELPGDWNRLQVGGGFRWQSGIYSDTRGPKGATRVHQGSYTLTDVMARYTFNPQLSAQLNINNLLDTSYYEQVGFYSQGWWGAPRSVNLSLSYRF